LTTVNSREALLLTLLFRIWRLLLPEAPEVADGLREPGMLRLEGKKKSLLAGSERFLNSTRLII
jgi:hypothetical protein